MNGIRQGSNDFGGLVPGTIVNDYDFMLEILAVTKIMYGKESRFDYSFFVISRYYYRKEDFLISGSSNISAGKIH